MRPDLVNRLRGIYTIPVNDGAGPLDGSDTFARAFPVPPINGEAADEIEQLRQEVERLKDVLHLDRSGLAAALEDVWRAAGGYAWAAEGRGPYEYDDEEYRAEMGRMVREICALARRALEASGNLAHAECCDRGKR